MEYKHLFDLTKKSINDIYIGQEADNIVWMLLSYYSQLSKLNMALCKTDVPENILQSIQKATEQLLLHRPIQYIINQAYFYGLALEVSEHVLIPRPETEELVDIIVKQNEHLQSLSILDIGTGSGCIPIALKNAKKKWQISGCDISKEALAVATKNARTHHTNIIFFEQDILNFDATLTTTYDVVISNPPYILLPEKQDMRNNVLLHEPHLALFVTDKDALQFYKAIVKFANKFLHTNGKLYFECNELFAQAVIELCIQNNYENCIVLQDLQGKNRFVMAQKK